ncbi:MAG: hypothetical protein NUV56_02535 [Candidatus Uhrbacteria bacterium]|nr:hypothetical protein [Candidatus Uhrbacteria bacterium]
MKLERVPASSLFRTNLFRDSPFIRQLCEEIGEVWTTHDIVYRGHFTTYFAVISLRGDDWYENPYKSDLYVVHELVHLKNRNVDPTKSWLNWIRRRADSEFQASVTSECMIYFLIDGLRERTFDHEIWVDRFKYKRGQPFDEIKRTIEGERLRALAAPGYNDFIEWQIHSYGAQNMQWYRIWAQPVGYGPHRDKPAFRVVEEHLADPNWSERHLEWIKEVTFSLDQVPFAHQATAFQTVYDETTRLWGNQFFSV